MRFPVLFLLSALAAAAADDNTFLLRGATVHPVTSPAIPNASLLVRDGKIAEIGAKIAVSRGLRVIDVKGLHVYPGLIDSASSLGLTEISSVRETVDVSEIGDFNPQLRALIAVNPASEHIPVTRANGITAAVTMPGGGIISGQAALIHLDGWTWQEMQLMAPVSLLLQFPAVQTGPDGSAPRSRRIPYPEARKNYEKRLRDLKEFLEQSRRYQKAKAAGGAGFEPDLKFEAMLPVLERKLPVVIRAARERALRAAIKFGEEEKLKIVIAGAAEAWKVAAELKAGKIPLILGPTLSLPLEEDDPYDRTFTMPAELHKAGVTFAFGSFSASFARNLPYQAAAAVAFGLPYEEGLKALTINAARIWGVGDRIGSIETGKLADLIVTDGDPLETRTQVRHMFINGRPVELGNKHKRLYEQYLSRP
jgi:imidazolonepropionase-like amidohydrolase